MAIQQIVDKKLRQPMTRKEFLGNVGALLLGVIGVTSVLHALGMQDKPGAGSHQAHTAASDYGGSAYGG